MVFQHFGLFPYRSVIDNIAYGLEVRGMGKVKRTEKAEETSICRARRLGERFPRELSGACSSVWASPAPWPWTPRSCSLMSPSQPSIR